MYFNSLLENILIGDNNSSLQIHYVIWYYPLLPINEPLNQTYATIRELLQVSNNLIDNMIIHNWTTTFGSKIIEESIFLLYGETPNFISLLDLCFITELLYCTLVSPMDQLFVWCALFDKKENVRLQSISGIG